MHLLSDFLSRISKFYIVVVGEMDASFLLSNQERFCKKYTAKTKIQVTSIYQINQKKWNAPDTQSFV